MFSIKKNRCLTEKCLSKRGGFVKFIFLREKIRYVNQKSRIPLMLGIPHALLGLENPGGDLRFSHKSGIVVKEEILNKSFFVVCQPEIYI